MASQIQRVTTIPCDTANETQVRSKFAGKAALYASTTPRQANNHHNNTKSHENISCERSGAASHGHTGNQNNEGRETEITRADSTQTGVMLPLQDTNSNPNPIFIAFHAFRGCSQPVRDGTAAYHLLGSPMTSSHSFSAMRESRCLS